MKSLIKFKWNKRWLMILVLPLCILAGCITIKSVTQPDTFVAGENITITMNVNLAPASTPEYARNGERVVIAFLAPKNWNADQNTTMTFNDATVKNISMVLIPDSVLTPGDAGLGEVSWKAAFKQRYGVGDNYLPDSLEWICFWSEKPYDYLQTININPTITIITKVGLQNVSFKPAYSICYKSEGLFSTFVESRKTINKTCMTVVGGIGELLDCCNIPMQTTVPGYALDNDIFTLTFDKKANPEATQLNGILENYVTMKGYTTDNDSIESQLLLTKTDDNFSDKYAVTFWPRQTFQLTPDQTLERIEYFYTNKAADKKIGFANLGIPFIYHFNCQ